MDSNNNNNNNNSNKNKRDPANTSIITLDNDDDEKNENEDHIKQTHTKEEGNEKYKNNFASKLFVDFRKNFKGSSDKDTGSDTKNPEVSTDIQHNQGEQRKKSFAMRIFMTLQNANITSPKGVETEQNCSPTTVQAPNDPKHSIDSQDNRKQRKKNFAPQTLLDFQNNFSRGGSQSSTNEKTSPQHTGQLQVDNMQSTNFSSSSIDGNGLLFTKEDEITQDEKNEREKRNVLKVKPSNVLPVLKDMGHVLMRPGKTSLASPLPPLKLAPIKKSSRTKKHKKSKKSSLKTELNFDKDDSSDEHKKKESFELKNHLEKLKTGLDNVFEPSKISTDIDDNNVLKSKSPPKKPMAITNKVENNIVSHNNAGFSKSVTKIFISENNLDAEPEEAKSQKPVSEKENSSESASPGICKKITNTNPESLKQNRPRSRTHRNIGDLKGNDLPVQNKFPSRGRSQTLSSANISNNSSTKNLSVKIPGPRSSPTSSPQLNNNSNTIRENSIKKVNKASKKAFVNKPTPLSTENSLLVREPTGGTKKRRSGTIEIIAEDENSLNNSFSRHVSASSATRSSKLDSTSIRKISRIRFTGEKR